jgi:uncharacterized damage-inducible protein DinB
MTEVARLVDQLDRAFDGDPWFGSSIVSVLDRVTAEQAEAHPVPGAHSIWELVLHMTGWKREVLARFRGATAGEPSDGDWPSPNTSDPLGWSNAVGELRRTHQELTAALHGATDDQLDAPVRDARDRPLGTGMTQWQTLQGILQHDIYHLGQIALLKRALRV